MQGKQAKGDERNAADDAHNVFGIIDHIAQHGANETKQSNHKRCKTRYKQQTLAKGCPALLTRHGDICQPRCF